jgi:hypothetical protein
VNADGPDYGQETPSIGQASIPSAFFEIHLYLIPIESYLRQSAVQRIQTVGSTIPGESQQTESHDLAQSMLQQEEWATAYALDQNDGQRIVPRVGPQA